jgi:hypothetical protein
MESPRPVTFVERQGPDADAALRRLRRRLEGAGTPARLLAADDQPELRLLVVEGAPALRSDETAGARVWRFREADEVPRVAGGDPA